MKILILGSSGILGKRLFISLKKHYKIVHTGLKKRKFNFEKTEEIKKLLLKEKPSLIINCLAIADIKVCETNRKYSNLINVKILREILKLKKTLNFSFIQFSTDQMYDNKTNLYSKESFNPVIYNEYTRQKINAEKICLKYRCLIFRINFFGISKSEKKTISDWVILSFKQKKLFYLFTDIIFNPLSLSSICEIIKCLIVSKKFLKWGIYNLGSKNSLSKASFAIKVAEYLNLKNKNYKLVNSSMIFKIKRPKNMSMDVSKFEKNFKIKMKTLTYEIKKEYLNLN